MLTFEDDVPTVRGNVHASPLLGMHDVTATMIMETVHPFTAGQFAHALHWTACR